jgi:uncharacterized protein (DUF111 family)
MRLNIKEIADKADMIINGYAFTKENEVVRVLNLNCLNHAAVILNDRIVETNMDDIENEIVIEYYRKNKQFMEEQDAEVL